MIGHPQGASGAAGVVTTALALDRGFLPPTINLHRSGSRLRSRLPAGRRAAPRGRRRRSATASGSDRRTARSCSEPWRERGAGRSTTSWWSAAGRPARWPALLLARRGWRVRLFDRAGFPRPEALRRHAEPRGARRARRGTSTWRRWRAIGPPDSRHAARAGPGGVAVCGTYPDGVAGLGVTRADFDAWLLGEAAARRRACAKTARRSTAAAICRRAGHRRAPPRAPAASGRIPARLVIAADGRRFAACAPACGLARARRASRGAGRSAPTSSGVADVRRRLRRDARARRPLPRHRAGAGRARPTSAWSCPIGAARRAVDAIPARRSCGAARRRSVDGVALRRRAPGLAAGRARADGDGRAGAGAPGPAAGRRRRRLHRSDDRRRHPPGAGRRRDSPPRWPTRCWTGRLAADAAPALLARRRRAALRAEVALQPRGARRWWRAGALRGARRWRACWPRAFEAMVCYAGDVGAAGRRWRRRAPRAEHRRRDRARRARRDWPARRRLSAHNAAVLRRARRRRARRRRLSGRCSGRIRSASWRWASKAR